MTPRQAAAALGRRGGKAKSDAKTRAVRENIRAYWARVKRGEVPPPRRKRSADLPVIGKRPV